MSKSQKGKLAKSKGKLLAATDAMTDDGELKDSLYLHGTRLNCHGNNPMSELILLLTAG